jgi:septal ring factor EnvC (AmiA/AmiB activator)
VAVLKARQDTLASLRARLAAEAGEVENAKNELAGSRLKKEQVLASIRRETAQQKKMLGELRETSRKLMEMLKESEATSEFAGKGFRGLKGRLPWPVSGRVTVPYGTSQDPRFKTPVFRNGVYIAAGEGAVARAVHKGEVVFADWFKGYGRLVVLNHGEGYHSLYANLSEIFLKPGDIIENMGEIGKVGESGLLERASLYFEIRYKGKALDPTQWLTRKTQ